MAEKRSHFGMAGHYAAMSEFLLRGYNVAIPSVDVGDDVFVVDDRQGTLRRVQVKTGDSSEDEQDAAGGLLAKTVRYNLSRRQLREQKASELFFMLMVRWDDRWRFLLVPRDVLSEMRDQFVAQDRAGKRGPRPKADASARSDTIGLVIRWAAGDATGWDTTFLAYLSAWPNAFPVITDGPGSMSRDPPPSPDPGSEPPPPRRAARPRAR